MLICREVDTNFDGIKDDFRWYNEKGFYEAKITNVEELTDDKGRVRLVVHIDEGRRAKVASIKYEGKGQLSDGELHIPAPALLNRDLPAEFGAWDAVYNRFRRWVASGALARLFASIAASDATHVTALGG